MHTEHFLKEIDTEIGKLTQLKQFIVNLDGTTTFPTVPNSKARRGPYKRRTRKMSPEARAKISKAVKARWAGLRKKAA